MFEELSAHLDKTVAKTVRQAVEAESHKLIGGMAINEMIQSILQKPYMTFPEDFQIVLKMGRSSAFALAKDDPDFPPLISIGNKRFMSTDKFHQFLAAKERAA